MKVAARFALLFYSIMVLLASPVVADKSKEEDRLNHLALDLMIEGQTRVMAIADRMRIAGASLCGKNISPVLGVYAPDHRSFSDFYSDQDFIMPFVEAASARFGLGPQPRILALVPQLPGTEVGLREGDRVMAVDGQPVEKRIYLDVLRGHGRSGEVVLKVARGDAHEVLRVEAPLGCGIPSRFMFGTSINAFAATAGSLTGIYFYAGMLRFLPDDHQLAVVVGHELAHLVLGHTNQSRTSERNEAEADHLGLYFVALAGYDVSRAPEIWDRFARQNPYSFIDWGFYSHPLSARRSLELRAIVAEIQRKREAGEPLEPEIGAFASIERPEVSEEAFESHQMTLREQALGALRSEGIG